MHIAVDKCKAEEGLSFKEYLEIIEKKGYITPPMKKWVSHIKDRGNDATHKLQPPGEDEAKNIITFTAQLLRLVYEMDHLADQFKPEKKEK